MSISFDNLPRYYGKTTNGVRGSLANLLRTKNARETMLMGNLSFLKDYGWDDPNRVTYYFRGVTGLSYEQMANQLGGANIQTANDSTGSKTYDTFRKALGEQSYDWVTVQEGDASVHGKYSFPGEDKALQGQNYPFPTVLRQKSVSGGDEVNLHYGRWPKEGLFWSEGIVSMDLIVNYDAAKQMSCLPLKLELKNISASGTPQFTYSTQGVVAATAAANTSDGYDVTLQGLRPGSTEVTAQLGNYTARLMVTVTADLTVSMIPRTVTEYVDEQTNVQLTLLDQKGNAVDGAVWEAIVGSPAIAKATLNGSTVTVKGVSEGETSLQIAARYALGGNTYLSEAVLPINIRMLGTLGIANTADTSAPIFRQGMLNRTLTGWNNGVQPKDVTYAAGTAPAFGNAALFLYAKGEDAALENFAVSDVRFAARDGAVLAPEDYHITFGAVEWQGGFSGMPFTVSRAEGAEAEIEVRITLQDQRADGEKYTLSIPCTAAETFRKYTLSFTGTNVWVDPMIIQCGTGAEVLLPAAPVWTKHTFLGWRVQGGDGSLFPAESLYGSADDFTSNVVMESLWRQNVSVTISGRYYMGTQTWDENSYESEWDETDGMTVRFRHWYTGFNGRNLSAYIGTKTVSLTYLGKTTEADGYTLYTVRIPRENFPQNET